MGEVPLEVATREKLISGILEFIGGELLPLKDVREQLEREIDGAGPRALVALAERLSMDIGWGYYPPDPLARRIHHLLADRFLQTDSPVIGVQHAARVVNSPVLIFANHLSYADANIVEILLQRSGANALADRLTAIAGPKIFTSRQRRFSSLCFGTVKVPQSTEVSSEEARLSAREVAQAARQSIDVAHERLRAGDALLVFGEGTRSRSGSLQPMIPAVARYLEVAGAWLLPVGLVGANELFPVDDATIRPARVTMQVGVPMQAETLLALAGGDRRLAMDAVGLAVAELLPVEHRGHYAEAAAFEQAGDVLRQARERACRP